MAIAPLPEIDEFERVCGLLESARPWPVLRVLPSAGPDAGRHGHDVAVRRNRRAVARRRRRAVLLTGVTGALVAGLALPWSALAGAPATSPRASAITTGATVYVVKSGDTLRSIADRFGAGDPRPLAEAIARETGSTTLVPGERIAVP